MMTKRKLKFGVSIGLTILLLFIGRLFLLGHYQEKANVALYLSGDYKTAIDYYSRLIFWRPNRAEYYYNRGEALSENGQFKEAVNDFKKALELGYPDSMQTILCIVLAAKGQGDFVTEQQALLHLLELSKGKSGMAQISFWAANYHLGQLEYTNGNYRKAINYYNDAHKVWPSHLEIYHRANAYFALGQSDSVRRDYNKSIRFVKRDFVKRFPNSHASHCDTCGFSFGSKEYSLLTESKPRTIIETLDEVPDNKTLKNINAGLKEIEKNGR